MVLKTDNVLARKLQAQASYVESVALVYTSRNDDTESSVLVSKADLLL